jgi:hypothetical protein
MDKTYLSRLRPLRGLFLVCAIVGFLGVNLPFLYYMLFDKLVYNTAMMNGVALIFIVEAMLLMLFFAFLVARLGWKRPGWLWFIVLSLVGSMAFSVPLMLYFQTGKEQ